MLSNVLKVKSDHSDNTVLIIYSIDNLQWST